MEEKKEMTFDQAREKALRLLEFRSHSEKELSDKLRRAGARAADMESLMAYLREYGLIDDRDYALRMARDLANLKKFGRYRIQAELKKRGVAAEYIGEALAQLAEDETGRLLPLVAKKLGGNFEQKNIDRAIRYFSYRGYGFDEIKRCIEQLKEE